MTRSRSRLLALRRSLLLASLALGLGAGVGLGCKKDGESEAPVVTAVEGPDYCPRQVPQKGEACPRGSSDFCIYRTQSGDFACVCGSGQWGCAAK